MLNLRVTKNFFDRTKVVNTVGARRRKAWSHFGGYVRKVAKNSIKGKSREVKLASMPKEWRRSYHIRMWRFKKGKGPRPRLPRKPSAPGTPPTSQSGTLERFLFYSLDPARKSVVVGPELVFSPTYGNTTTMGLLEKGGSVRKKSGRVIKHPQRPYMLPAFETAKQRLPQIWIEAVGK